ncbi:polyprenyl synthetase family protein [Actinomycetospora sp. TBRC 11914]|uniref:polyprenyl synthetase family protein n=1 Tax=Actinomycetospora sp. TBRC 11914 TaxID=2729387 RepID=UPI00145EE804|nr:polyprenyl synthetase family protein [Actinomycetospora sp. TBRC 11914]NMO91899.1 polyprenyl synthetase family protein [Actinomycetospora sp. TBRC 11914]
MQSSTPAGSSPTAATQVAGLPIADEALAAEVTAGLERVEDLLRQEVHSDYRFVADTSLHLIEAGGKRFRPLLTLLAAQLAGGTSDDVVVAATSVELVHLATLYHDDVMDEAVLRRGAQSANARWDNTVAILTGDYLFAHASRLVSQLGPDAVRIIAETFAELVTGQMRETRGPRGDDPVGHYMAVVAEKTGSLIATAGRFGAMFAGARPADVEALRRFGEIIGTAFQVSDDIIDIASPSGDSGKTPGTDLREGVATLPVLYALADDGPDAHRLRALGVGEEEITDDAVIAEALEILRGSDGLVRAREALDAQARAARDELAGLPAGPARDALSALLDYTVERVG